MSDMFAAADHTKLNDLIENGMRSIRIGNFEIFLDENNHPVNYSVMDSSYFNEYWLENFAVANVGGKEYFNMTDWGKLTDNHTKGVIIIDEQNSGKVLEPLFIIPSFTDIGRDDELTANLNYIGRYANKVNSADVDESKKSMMIKEVSDGFVNALETISVDQKGIADLVPLQYYYDNGVNPVLLQDMVYIRDNYRYRGESILPDTEIFDRIQDIIGRDLAGEGTTEEEKEFISEVTNGEFIFNNGANTVDINKQTDKPKTNGLDVEEGENWLDL